jgi:hypothetical protein
MNTAKKVLIVSLSVLAAVAVLAPTLRFLTGPGMGGPENVAPVKQWLGPGTGGPDSVQLARYWLGPGGGGPEKVVPCYILMGFPVRNDL